MIDLQSYYTSDGKYPERATSAELTDEKKANAAILLDKVNGFLMHMNIPRPAISSGFRTLDANNALPNAAKASNHMKCLAIDLEDKDRSLTKICLDNLSVLAQYGLYMEDSASTPSWVHLQCVPPHSGNRVFKP